MSNAPETPTVEQPAPRINDAVEVGIFLTQYDKHVHGCKVRTDIGAAVTRCGIRFLIGDQRYRSEATFGEPAKEDSDGTWTKCPKCVEHPGYEGLGKMWRNWKQTVMATLRMIGR
jgi:hypothetical protein